MARFLDKHFWRLWAVALVAGLFYLGSSLHGGQSVLPVASAGGVFGHPRPGYVFTTSEAGDVLYAWPILGQGRTTHLERWSWAEGAVTYKSLGAYTPVPPGTPGGTVPIPPYYDPNQPLPPMPEPGGTGGGGGR